MNHSRPERRSQPAIKLHIEHLVLEGIAGHPSQGAMIKRAMESELARLLAHHGMKTATSQTTARLAGGKIEISRTATSRQIGQQIGRGVFTAINSSGQKQPGQQTKGQKL